LIPDAGILFATATPSNEMPIPELDLAIRNLILKLGLGSVIE
jgi:hypothetical protein